MYALIYKHPLIHKQVVNGKSCSNVNKITIDKSSWLHKLEPLAQLRGSAYVTLSL